jgi:hypothetical protein
VSAASITAVCTGIAGIIGAITALVVALKAKGTATVAKTSAVAAHARIDALRSGTPVDRAWTERGGGRHE